MGRVSSGGSVARFAAMPGMGRAVGFSGRSFHGQFGHRHFRRFSPFFVGVGVPYFYNDYYYANYPYDDCYRAIRVHTRYGWRVRRVDVCG